MSSCWWSLLLNEKLWLKKCYAAAVNLHQSADHTYNLFGGTDCLSWRRFCSSHLMFTLNGDKCKCVLSACPWCLPFEDTMFDWFACPGPRLIFISQICSGGYNHEPQTTLGFLLKIKSVARCSFPQKCGKSEVLDLTTYNHELWIGNSLGWFWFDNPLQGIQKFLIFLWDMIWFVDFNKKYQIHPATVLMPRSAMHQMLQRMQVERHWDSENAEKNRGKMRNVKRWPLPLRFYRYAERFQVFLAKFMKRLLWRAKSNYGLFFHDSSNEDLKWTYVT